MRAIFLVLALFLLCGMLFAQGPSAGLKQNVMEMQYNKIQCRAAFNIGVLELVKTKVTDLDVDSVITATNEDMAALKTASENRDRAAYNTALKELTTDAKDIVSVYMEALKQLKGAQRQSLKTDFVALKDAKTDCLAGTSVDLGKAQSEYVTWWLTHAKNISGNLKAKGMETTKLDGIVAEAGNKLTQLDNAVATGNDKTVQETTAKLKAEHLHLWARFHIERLRILTNAMSGKAMEKGITVDVTAITALLNAAEEKVKVGQPYSEGEFQQVKETLKDAAAKMRELFKKLK